MLQKDIPIIFPDGDVIVLDQYLGKGLQPNEKELPEDAPGELSHASIIDWITDKGNAQQRNRFYLNSTRPRSPSSKRWVSRWYAVKKRC